MWTLDSKKDINSISIPKQPSTAELERVAETEVFINYKSSNPDFILPNNPVFTFNENQSLSQPAGSDECTRSFTSGSNVSDSGSFTYLDHTQKLKRNHVQNFMFSHVATQTETET